MFVEKNVVSTKNDLMKTTSCKDAKNDSQYHHY